MEKLTNIESEYIDTSKKEFVLKCDVCDSTNIVETCNNHELVDDPMEYIECFKCSDCGSSYCC